MPTEGPSKEEHKNFLEKTNFELLKCFPSKLHAANVMFTMDVLSDHSMDEEYLGNVIEPSWDENPTIRAVFECFSGKLKDLEGTINERNSNLNLKNRTSAGILPYELLNPISMLGVTGMGVPYSISI